MEDTNAQNSYRNVATQNTENDMFIYINRRIFDGMLAHAQSAFPKQCVGMLFGQGNVATKRTPFINIADKPEEQFFADPNDLLDALHNAELNKQILLATYHSHPKGVARPSIQDLAQAHYSVPNLIIVPSSRNREYIVKGYFYRNVGYDEVQLKILG